MSRRRIRGAEYRARRHRRHLTRHYYTDEPLANGGGRITEYRRDAVVSLNVDSGFVDGGEADHAIEVSVERGNQSVSP